MKVLVIQQKMIGDVLTSTIICEALRKEYPGVTIDYLVNSNTIPVIQENPFFDTIVEFKNEYQSNRRLFYSFLKKIRSSKYDLVIDAYGKLESNLISLFSGAKDRITFHKWHSSFLYTKTVYKQTVSLYSRSIAIENRLRLVYPENKIDNHLFIPKVFITDLEKATAKVYLESNGITLTKNILIISVLGSSPEKTYPLPYMSQLLDHINKVQPETQILFNYIPNQIKDAQEIYNHCSEKTKKQIFFNVYGNNLREFLAITHHCNALIGNEGGATNMAKALNIKTFVIFAPYLNKSNWYGASENIMHKAVHLSDYTEYDIKDTKKAKQNPTVYYLKFKPIFIFPELSEFLTSTK